ncbi:UNVERIFIED_CONTAM: hypothetical protein PYX00_011575 [Menopon gallinae]|uniref:Uncharacterized protein n=1 Tax=Menopon gallinae TaxID=328185 RepID=A0AAW2H804_9NEOP
MGQREGRTTVLALHEKASAAHAGQGTAGDRPRPVSSSRDKGELWRQREVRGENRLMAMDQTRRMIQRGLELKQKLEKK